MDSIAALPNKLLRSRSVGILTAGIFGAVLAVAVVVAVVSVLGSVISPHAASVAQLSRVKDYTKALQECMGSATRVTQPIREDLPAFKEIWITCANQIYLVDLMEDFDIRREKLLR